MSDGGRGREAEAEGGEEKRWGGREDGGVGTSGLGASHMCGVLTNTPAAPDSPPARLGAAAPG